MAACGNIINAVEIGLLLVALGCGMAAAAMVGLTTSQFEYKCILKADVEDLGFHKILVHFSNISRCNFCLLIHVAGILLAFVFVGYRILVLCSGKFDIQTFGRFVFSILFGVLTFLLLVDACLITVGINTFCSNMFAVHTYATTCRHFQESINWSGDVDGAHFYDNMQIAEITSWICVILWLIMTALSLVLHCVFKRSKPRTPPTLPETINPGMII